MVGYSRLIGLDDAGTLERLRGLRNNLIDPAIEEHGGRIVQTGGDSLLIVFDSIDGALRCAMKVQQEVPVLDGDQSRDRVIRFRIGINVGDVIPDGTDLQSAAADPIFSASVGMLWRRGAGDPVQIDHRAPVFGCTFATRVMGKQESKGSHGDHRERAQRATEKEGNALRAKRHSSSSVVLREESAASVRALTCSRSIRRR